MILFLFISSIILGLIYIVEKNSSVAIKNNDRRYLLSGEEIANKQRNLQTDNIVTEVIFDEKNAIGDGTKQQADGVFVPAYEQCSITFDIPVAGEYQIAFEYKWVSRNLFENLVNVSVNNHSIVSSFPFLWVDEISELNTDRYGNEIVSEQYQLDESSITYLEDYEHFYRTPIVFSLTEGDNIITLAPQNQDMIFVKMYLLSPEEDITYEEYKDIYKDAVEFEDIITVEGENYRAKSDSFIRGRNSSNTGVVPNDPYIKLINITDDKSNKAMGQKVIYEVEAPMDGIYYLSFKYNVPLKTGGLAFRTIEVDGKVPFKEAIDVGFKNTGINKYQNFTFGDEKPMGIYLSKGIHTIALKVTAGKIDHLYRELMEIVQELNDTGILIKKIKGSNSDDTAKIDTNRTWDILQYMPDILTKLQVWEERITNVYNELEEIGGMKPSYASDLMLAAQNLERIALEPREIPNRISLLSDDASSAAQLISLTLTKIYEQNLSLDRFYLHGIDYYLPSPKASAIKGFVTSIKQFIYSFSPIMNEDVDISNSEGKLTVWINKPSQYVEGLRELTAKDFTMETGIDVVFSIMPDEKKITLANSTKTNPDMALGLSYYRPAEFAMRGMAKNLLEYDDFLDWYSEEYNLQSLTPMAYEDGVYGASETQDFYVLFYRTDILEMLGLEIPDTWDDVKKMMPTLHRNAMNFNLTLANNVGYKPFESTSSFIYQNGGDYYSKDGFTSNFNDPKTLKGLREMVDLFQVYGMAQNIPNFFNAFRSGTTPIGISNFATYIQLQVGAPELTGRWDIALIPGTAQEDGSTLRYYSTDMTSAMIFSNTEMEREAYQFLKWWLSSDTQTKYSGDMQMKYGPDYIWNTANHVAMGNMSYPQKHKDIILEQWIWQKEVPRHPASYILEREVSNAWIDIVTKGSSFQPRIDEATLASNREMKRKLTEFGYYDEEGNKLKEYNVNLVDDLIEQLNKKEDGHE